MNMQNMTLFSPTSITQNANKLQTKYTNQPTMQNPQFTPELNPAAPQPEEEYKEQMLNAANNLCNPLTNTQANFPRILLHFPKLIGK